MKYLIKESDNQLTLENYAIKTWTSAVIIKASDTEKKICERQFFLCKSIDLTIWDDQTLRLFILVCSFIFVCLPILKKSIRLFTSDLISIIEIRNYRKKLLTSFLSPAENKLELCDAEMVMSRGRILLLIHFIVVVIVTTLYPWDVKQETEERCIKRKFIPSVETLKEKKSLFSWNI